MTLAARTVLVVLVAGLSVAFVWAVYRTRPVADVALKTEVPADPPSFAGSKGLAVGATGCLGAACHGAPAKKALEQGEFDDGSWQSSGSCWVAADPHTGAYSLLTDRPYRAVKVTAEHIMARYDPGKKATEDARCLGCHSNPAFAHETFNGDAKYAELRAEGVGCEACHGNAGGWLRSHTTWKGDRAKVYDESGMVKLYDLGERAVTCAGCHIGAPASGPPGAGTAVRDMNHDMIAAGHPRLNFDFAEYQRRLPVHWWEKDRTAGGNVPRGPGFAAKSWLVGRVAHAEAACRLLDDRAARSLRNDAKTPWPEFAEFNCAACHHNLPAEWRGQVLGTRPPGVPPWQAIWPVTPALGLQPPHSAELLGGARAKGELEKLLTAIETARPAGARAIHSDDGKGKALTAASALRELRMELNALSEAEAIKRAQAVLGGSRTPDGTVVIPDWDSGLQMLFGLAALDRAQYPKGAPRNKNRDELFRAAFTAYRETGRPEIERWPEVVKAITALHPKK